jgi:hypothetical protein
MTSKIKVDNIENQCGGAVVTKCGGTTTISGTVVKSNTLQASDAGNIISQSGTTITLGASGDTINLAGGASQSGFGRTGTVDWQTTPVTATFTAANGVGYFCNTSGGAFTANLPAGVAGAIISLADYSGTFATNSLTISANGSEKIAGETTDPILNTSGQSVTLVYVDATEGWVTTSDSSENIAGSAFIVATGGTISTSGNCRIHTFTGPGTFSVTQVAISAPDNSADYLVVAGGGGGGKTSAGGAGGAGGFRTSFCAPATPITISVQNYPITVGAGGVTGGPTLGTPAGGTRGSNAVALGITSTGGGGGPTQNADGGNATGGSGAGGTSSGTCYPGGTGGAGNTPPVSPPQGNNGGNGSGSGSYGEAAGGGGGASAVGTNSNSVGPLNPSNTAGNGGNGETTSINGSATVYAGGGGGGLATGTAGTGGTGGGGTGGRGSNPANPGLAGSNGSANTGGGGGGDGDNPASAGYDGGSGIVIIRYKFQ